MIELVLFFGVALGLVITILAGCVVLAVVLLLSLLSRGAFIRLRSLLRHRNGP